MGTSLRNLFIFSQSGWGTQNIFKRSVNLGNPATGIDFSSAQYGRPIPVVYGQNKVAGNTIWYGEFATTTTSQSGKGGGQATGYAYSASFQLALCEGTITGVADVFDGTTVYTGGVTAIGGVLALGTAGQAPWAHLSGPAALGYSKTAIASFANYNLGSSASLPNLNFEIQGLHQYNVGGGLIDANPSDILTDICTDADHGVNFNFLGSLTQYSNYCVANGILLSPVYDTQSTAQQALADLLTYTNSEGFFSEGVLKVVPRGDTTVTGNGVTFTPVTTIQYSLDATCFVTSNKGDAPVTVTRKAPADCKNMVRVGYSDRAYSYHPSVQVSSIDYDILVNGARADVDHNVPAITTAACAKIVGQNLLQQLFYVRNVYSFRLPWRFCRLEPMDLVALTDPNLQLVNFPVRIIEIEEDEAGLLSVTAEEYPQGIGFAISYPVEPQVGIAQDTKVDPGPVDAPYIFRGPGFLVNNNQPEIWCAVTGANNLWGGAQAFLSYDGTSYHPVGQMARQSLYGVTNSAVWPGAGVVMKVGELIQDSHGNTQQVQSVTSDAKTGGSAPAWNDTLAGTTTDNHVTWVNISAILQPPGAPAGSSVTAGALAATNYWARCTWVSANGETLAGTELASFAVAVNKVLVLTQPASPPAGAVSWRAYVSNTAGGGSGHETLQATIPVATTTWQEPNTGLVAGAAMPTSNTSAADIAWPVGAADPDIVNLPEVYLNFGQLQGGVQADADNFGTLSMVGTEIVSYETATLKPDGGYELGYLRRGAYGSTNVRHLQGESFVRLDQSIVRIPVDPSLIGQTVFLKFLSINVFNKTPRTLAGETAYSYVVGTNAQLPDVPPTPSGFALTSIADGISLSWSHANPAAAFVTSIERSPNGSTWTVLDQVGVATTTLQDHFTTGTLYYYRARARGPLPQSGWSSYTAVLSNIGKYVANGATATGAGKNACPNPSFELNAVGAISTDVSSTVLPYTAVGTVLCDNWSIENNVSGNFLFGLVSYAPFVLSGARSMGVELAHGATIPASTTQNGNASSSRLGVRVGEVLSVYGNLGGYSGVALPAGVTGAANLYIEIYDVNGAAINSILIGTAAVVNGSLTYSFVNNNHTIAATEGSGHPSSIALTVQLSIINSSGSSATVTSSSLPAIAVFDDLFLTLGDPTVAGNGVQLGDSRNVPGATSSGVGQGFYLSGMALSSPSPTEIDCTSGTLLMGGSGTGNVPYNSSSVTGLIASTKYYLYYIDPGFRGGSATLHATTNNTTLQNISPYVVYIGFWTTPASGSGGGGGAGGCLHESMGVGIRRGGRQLRVKALDIVVGDEVRARSGEWVPVLEVEHQPHEDWIEVSADVPMYPSISAFVTETQPFYKPDGTMVRASDVQKGDVLDSRNGPATVFHVGQSRNGPALKVILKIPAPHLFYTGEDGFMVHNGNPKP